MWKGKLTFKKFGYSGLLSTLVDMNDDKKSWTKLEKDLDSADFNRSLKILEGGNDLPPLYGYGQGYKMVKSYLALHPEVSAEQ